MVPKILLILAHCPHALFHLFNRWSWNKVKNCWKSRGPRDPVPHSWRRQWYKSVLDPIWLTCLFSHISKTTWLLHFLLIYLSGFDTRCFRMSWKGLKFYIKNESTGNISLNLQTRVLLTAFHLSSIIRARRNSQFIVNSANSTTVWQQVMDPLTSVELLI